MLFQEERFGMFLHYGIYAQHGWHEQEQMRLGVPKAEYIKLQDAFNPSQFDAEQWVRFAKDAGAEYICFTAKHHDGFCMWDTKYTDYKITNTPFGRDILKELSEACAKYGILLEIYYSCPDWHYKHSVNRGESHQLPCPNPGDEPNDDLYVEYVKNQVRELCTNYGRISGFFWDIPPIRRDPSVNELVRSLQPGILINDRGYDSGDYSTPEREECIKAAQFDRLCEACQSVGMQAWGYRKNEDYFTPQSLIASMSSIMIKGGNFLLNIGPDAEGKLPAISQKIFSAVGDWYLRVKESIVGCRFLSIGGRDYTCRGNKLYLHLPAAYGSSGIVLKPLRTLPKRTILLNDFTEIEARVEYTPHDYTGGEQIAHLHLQKIPAERYLGENMVICMEFEDINRVLADADVKAEAIIL